PAWSLVARQVAELDAEEDAAGEAQEQPGIAADRAAPAAVLDVAGHARHFARHELEGLVDQVGAPVEEDAAAGLGVAAPAARAAVAQVGTLEEVRVADQALGEHLLNRQIIPVPAAVLEDAEEDPVAPARRDHGVGLADVEAHHLVDDDVLARVQRGDRD